MKNQGLPGVDDPGQVLDQRVKDVRGGFGARQEVGQDDEPLAALQAIPLAPDRPLGRGRESHRGREPVGVDRADRRRGGGRRQQHRLSVDFEQDGRAHFRPWLRGNRSVRARARIDFVLVPLPCPVPFPLSGGGQTDVDEADRTLVQATGSQNTVLRTLADVIASTDADPGNRRGPGLHPCPRLLVKVASS